MLLGRSRHPILGLVCFAWAVFALGSSLLAGERLEPITVESFPAGAQVTVDGRRMGRTPLLVHLSATTAHEILVEAQGYEPRRGRVRRVVRVGVLRNLAFAGLGWGLAQTAVELVRGEGYRLEPSVLVVRLDRSAESAARPPNGSTR